MIKSNEREIDDAFVVVVVIDSFNTGIVSRVR